MEKRLCYCNSCRSFYIIDPVKSCPKCGRGLISSVVTEAEWDRSTDGQRSAFKSSLSSLAHSQNTSTRDSGRSSSTSSGTWNSGRSSQSGSGAGSHSYYQSTSGRSADFEKKLKSYKNWSIAIAVIGIISFFALIGQVAQLEAQGYIVTNKTPLYLGCGLSIFCAIAGFYGKSVYKQSSRLNNSWIFFIIALIGMAFLGIVYQVMPGWLCVVGCAVNVYNGYKLKKMV